MSTFVVSSDAINKRKLADLKLSTDELDEADHLLFEADVHLDNMLAPPMERGLFYMSKFTLARKRWNRSSMDNEKEMNKACFYLDKALKVFHNRFPSMAAKAVKEAALFGHEMGNTKVRNVAATILYTMPLKKEDDGEEEGGVYEEDVDETEEQQQQQQQKQPKNVNQNEKEIDHDHNII